MTAAAQCSKASRSRKKQQLGHCMKTTTTGARRRAGNESQAIVFSEMFSSHSLQS